MHEEYSCVCGLACSFFINYERNVFSVGKNSFCKLGNEINEDNIFNFYQIPSLCDIKMIACGEDHTICLDFNGYCYSFGSNESGKLGIGKDKNELDFTHIPQKINLPLCKQITCGEDFTLCLIEDGSIYSFGENSEGQLGLGNHISYDSPQELNISNIELIWSGGNFSICKSNTDTYFSWGLNNSGELGHGNLISKNQPTQCYHYPKDIKSIVCGKLHWIALTEEGIVYVCGSNNCSQIGENALIIKISNIPIQVSTLPEIKKIYCGEYHNVCIDTKNDIWVFGSNLYAQLGVQSNSSEKVPINHPSLHNIIDVSIGGYHTFVKTSSNEILAFGDNDCHQLGFLVDIEETNVETPIQVLKDNEEIWCNTYKSRAKSARK